MDRSNAFTKIVLALCLVGQAHVTAAADRHLAHAAQVESLTQIVELMVSDLAMARIAARQAQRPEVREFADGVVRDLDAVCATTQDVWAKVSAVPLQLRASRMHLIEDWELSNAPVDRAFLDAVATDQAQIGRILILDPTVSQLPPRLYDQALRLASTTRDCAHSLLGHSFESACGNFNADRMRDRAAEFVQNP
jgi:predicted outer membrane protein